MSQPESPLYKLLRRQSLAFLAAALVAGFLLIAFGAFLERSDPFWSKLLVTLGSSGLGTCLGLVFGSLTGSSALQRVKDLVEKTLNSNLNASESELSAFRTLWHHYLVTKIDGKSVWRYRTIDFSQTAVPGKLIAALTVPAPDGAPHSYTIEAFLSSPRLLFVQKAAVGAEAPIVHVYPFATEYFRSIIYGAAYLQTWDGDYLAAPALISRAPIDLSVAKLAEGTLPEATYAKLDEMWKMNAQSQGLILNGRP